MENWRKQVRRAAALAAALCLLSRPLATAADRPGLRPDARVIPSVTVKSDRGTYRIEGSFRVDVSPPVAWAVLTDYDNLPSFISSMRSSGAAREASGRLLVTQDAEGRLGPFARKLHVVLEVTEQPRTRIAFRDICGGSFHSYVGAWTISSAGSTVLVSYSLEARPRSSPPLFARSILASNTRGLLAEVRVEMLRREPPPTD